MKKIIPAILTSDIKDFENKIRLIRTFFQDVHVDIMDGKFVSGKSVEIPNILSYLNDFKVTFHLMVEEPFSYFDLCSGVVGSRVIFHVESMYKVNSLDFLSQYNFGKIIAINPETSWHDVERFLPFVEGVLFLGVNPGFGGQLFIPEILEKIEEFHNTYPTVRIDVDGGVNENTIPRLVGLGVSEFVVGSGLFGSPQVFENFNKLERLLL